MVIPVNTDVHINLTSTDVIHGFYVKEFNFSRYALPGVMNQFTLRAVQHRHLLRPVHAAVRPLPLADVLQGQGRHPERSTRRWLAGFTNSARPRRPRPRPPRQQTSSHVPSKPTASSGAK